jgi:aldose 1-epimerase
VREVPTRVLPMPPSGRQVELIRGDQVAVVVEVGGGLRCYRVGDMELTDGYGVGEMCSGARGQTLIPWPNRLRDGRYEFEGQTHQLPLSEPEKRNAIHGLVRWVNWTLAHRADDRVTMEHLLHPQAGYPFALRLTITYEIDEEGLTVRTTATNVGETVCPYGAGAHPYLALGTATIDSLILRAPGATWLPEDERGIPTGAEPVEGTRYDFRRARPIGDVNLDTAYADLERDEDGRARVELRTEDGKRAVSLWLDASYRYLMLFTGDSLPEVKRRRQGLGIEPMTCPPNAFASGEGLCRLAPGESFSSAWGITPGRAVTTS